MPTAAAVAAAAVTAKITAMDVATTQLPKPEEPAAPTGVRVCTDNVYGYTGSRLQRVPLQGAPGYNEQIFLCNMSKDIEFLSFVYNASCEI